MKTCCLVLLIVLTIDMNAQEFPKYRWKKRVVVLVSTNFTDSVPLAQQKQFHENKTQLRERDMIILHIDTNSEQLKGFHLVKDFEGVLLIGKDGGLKAKYPFIVEPIKLFDLVDGMPMRKVEMRRKKGN